MDEELDNLAPQYALTRGIILRERLGFGIHGTVLPPKTRQNQDF
jgi:hypothetical protein